MQKSKPIEYIQAILYLIKCHWRKLVMAVLVTITVVLAFIYAGTGNKVCYSCGVGAGIITVLISCVVYAPEISKKLDKLGMFETPADEVEEI